jgi:hypothetical protein
MSARTDDVEVEEEGAPSTSRDRKVLVRGEAEVMLLLSFFTAPVLFFTSTEKILVAMDMITFFKEEPSSSVTKAQVDGARIHFGICNPRTLVCTYSTRASLVCITNDVKFKKHNTWCAVIVHCINHRIDHGLGLHERYGCFSQVNHLLVLEGYLPLLFAS